MATVEGGCACGSVRYEAALPAIFVQCCHCTRCQSQSGSAFALNAMIEADHVRLTSGELEAIETPSESGKGQKICRCAICKTAVWGVYNAVGPKFLYVRVGSMDQPELCPPGIHIFTDSKQPWVRLPAETPAVPQFYDRKEYWPPESLERLEKA